jgi:hypothetical protein
VSIQQGTECGLSFFELAAKTLGCTFSFWSPSTLLLPYKIGAGGTQTSILVLGSEFFPTIPEDNYTDEMKALPGKHLRYLHGKKDLVICVLPTYDQIFGTIAFLCRIHNMCIFFEPHTSEGRLVFDIVHHRH